MSTPDLEDEPSAFACPIYTAIFKESLCPPIQNFVIFYCFQTVVFLSKHARMYMSASGRRTIDPEPSRVMGMSPD